MASPAPESIFLEDFGQTVDLTRCIRETEASDTQLFRIIQTCPKLLASDPKKIILPKLDFLLSKGASSFDLVHIVTKNPHVLLYNLEKTLTPGYDFVKRFLLSDESTIHSLKSCVCLLYSNYPAHNIQVLLENGVPELMIALVLRYWCEREEEEEEEGGGTTLRWGGMR